MKKSITLQKVDIFSHANPGKPYTAYFTSKANACIYLDDCKKEMKENFNAVYSRILPVTIKLTKKDICNKLNNN